MAGEDTMNVRDDVYAFFDFIRSKFKDPESSKVERALSLWDDGTVDHALKHFKLILRTDESGFNEKIIARAGMVIYFIKQGKTEKALSRLGMISGMLRDKFFLGSCSRLGQSEWKDIGSENATVAVEVFKRLISIVEKLEIESEKAGEKENKRVAGVIRISARINLAKLQVFQEMWEEGLENLLQAEELAVAKKDHVVLLEIYCLIIKICYNLEGKNSENARKYQEKHLAALNTVAKKR